LGGLCEPGAGIETVGEVCEVGISGEEVMLWDAAVFWMFIFTFPEIEILFVVMEGASEVLEKESAAFAELILVGGLMPKLGLA
jgi:hypothetical protein